MINLNKLNRYAQKQRQAILKKELGIEDVHINRGQFYTKSQVTDWIPTSLFTGYPKERTITRNSAILTWTAKGQHYRFVTEPSFDSYDRLVQLSLFEFINWFQCIVSSTSVKCRDKEND